MEEKVCIVEKKLQSAVKRVSRQWNPTWPTSAVSSSWCKRDERRLQSAASVPPHASVRAGRLKWRLRSAAAPLTLAGSQVCVGRCTKVLIQLFANVWAPFLWCFNLDVMKTNPQRPHPKSQQLFNNIHAQPRGDCIMRSGSDARWSGPREQNPRAA